MTDHLFGLSTGTYSDYQVVALFPPGTSKETATEWGQAAGSGYYLEEFPILDRPPRQVDVYRRKVGVSAERVEVKNLASCKETYLFKDPEPVRVMWQIRIRYAPVVVVIAGSDQHRVDKVTSEYAARARAALDRGLTPEQWRASEENPHVRP